MSNSEKIIQLYQLKKQIDAVHIPAYVPMAADLKALKEALLLVIQIVIEDKESE